MLLRSHGSVIANQRSRLKSSYLSPPATAPVNLRLPRIGLSFSLTPLLHRPGSLWSTMLIVDSHYMLGSGALCDTPHLANATSLGHFLFQLPIHDYRFGRSRLITPTLEQHLMRVRANVTRERTKSRKWPLLSAIPQTDRSRSAPRQRNSCKRPSPYSVVKLSRSGHCGYS